MAEIDNSDSMKRASDEVNRLIERLRHHERVAEQAAEAAKKDATFQRRLSQEMEKQVREGKIKERTLSQRGSPAEAARAKQTEADQAARTEKSVRNIRTEEERIARTRAASTRHLIQDLQVLQRYGPYAGTRALEREGATPAQIALARDVAARTRITPGVQDILNRYGPHAGMRFLERRGLSPVPSDLVEAYRKAGAQAVPDQTEAAAQANRQVARGADEAARATERQIATQAKANRVYAQGVSSMAQYSTEMRRHGALTTEFISAAGRGAVTVRELGFQVGSTIGKFGGWLLAGSAIFTALGAVSALGRGAIESASGVNQLDRVLTEELDADQVTEDFRRLQAAFNLPMDQVTQAAYGMGKVFQDQAGAIEGAEAALFAVKVGELDVATATRYLTAIVNGFNLPADQMMRVMDQLNEAQNRFGVSIPDTAAGVAKAAGTFRAAGGDINTLIALITTAQKATGQTGEVVGTALARSPNFLRQDTNQEILRSFGIDPTQDIDRVIDQAFVRAQDLSGQRLQILASAIFGPHYSARIGTPLLQQFERYQKALRDTSPQEAAGSAQRELNILLASYQERLTRVVSSLEQLGSNLADAGILAPLGASLQVLQSILDVTNGLLDLFNELPRPVRTLTTNLVAMYGVLRLMRRFQVGELFPEGSFGRQQFTPPDIERRRYQEALFQQLSATNRDLESVGMRHADLASEYTVTHRAAMAAKAADEMEEFNFHADRMEGLQKQIYEAQVRENALLERRRLIVEQQALLARGISEREIAAAYGVGLAGTGQRLPTGDAALRALIARGDADPQQVALAQRALAQQSNRFVRQAQQLSQRGGIVSRSFALAAVGMGRVAGGIGSIGRTMGNFFRAVAASIGPLDIVLAGAYATFEVVSHAIRKAQQVAAPSQDIGAIFRNQQEVRKQIEEYEAAAAAAEDYNLLERAQGAFADVANALLPGDPAASPQEVEEQFAEAYKREVERLREGTRGARRALRRGEVVPAQFREFVYPEFVQRGIDEAVARFNEGVDSAVEFSRNTDNLIQSVRESYNLSNRKQRELISEIRSRQIESQGLGRGRLTHLALAQLNPEDQQDLLETYAQVISAGVASARELDEFLRIGVDQAAGLIDRRGVEARAQGATAIDTLTENIKAAAEAELERALLFAETSRDRDRAYNEYVQALSPQRAVRSVRRQMEDARRRLRAVQETQSNILRERDRHDARALGVWQDFLGSDASEEEIAERFKRLNEQRQNLSRQLRRKRDEERKIRQQIDGLQRTERLMRQRLRELQQEARQQRFDERTEELEAINALQESRVPDGIERMREQLSNLNRMLARERRAGALGDPNRIRELLAERNELIDQIFEQQTQIIGTRFDLQIAGIDSEDEVGRARLELAKARALAARAQQQGDPLEALEAAVEVREAERALQDAIEERAEAIADARFALQRARAGEDDVELARIDLRAAARSLRTADTLAERLQARADRIEARRELRDALARREIEDVEFAADIGRLSLDAQIREYQRILRTMTMSRDLRRDLRRRIYDLKRQLDEEGGGFDLAVSDIKLPTVYEIRRAIQGGINQPPQVNINTRTDIQVNGARDPRSVVDEIERRQNDAARRNRNALRSVGVV